MGHVRRVLILGSTGSIGVQALDVIAANRDRFEVVGLAAGTNVDLVRSQAAAFGVADIAMGAEEAAQLVRTVSADVVLNGITGSVGLGPTLAALEVGATRSPTRKASLSVVTWSNSAPAPARLCPWTRSIPRSRRRFVPEPLARCAALYSPPRVVHSGVEAGNH